MTGRARNFAEFHHEGQRRKYTGEPYIEHPARVAELVRARPHTEAMLAAAWLHDVVEDCGVSLAEIFVRFGPGVAFIVHELTDAKIIGSNRAYRKQVTRARLAAASWEAQTIKCADVIDNVRGLATLDPAFAKVAVPEMRANLEVMFGADPVLRMRADKAVREEEKKL